MPNLHGKLVSIAALMQKLSYGESMTKKFVIHFSRNEDDIMFFLRKLNDNPTNTIRYYWENKLNNTDFEYAMYQKYKDTELGELINILCQPEMEKSPEINMNNIEETLKELNNLPGLANVKKQVNELLALVIVNQKRNSLGLKSAKQNLHMLFKGNPGTGKTTVARLLGKILKDIGILSKGHVVEISRADLTSMYQGQFEQKLKEHVENATGGILFIDEIYSIASTKRKEDQGNDGVATLLMELENKSHDFICIGAGYSEQVEDFVGVNPGLLSRFAITLDFENYNMEELVNITNLMFSEREYEMGENFEAKLREAIEGEINKKDFGNARTIRNIVEQAIRSQALRLYENKVELSKDNLLIIDGDDFFYTPIKEKEEETAEQAFEKFKELIGGAK